MMIWVNWALVAAGGLFVAIGYASTFSSQFVVTVRGLPARLSLNLAMAYVAWTLLPQFTGERWAPVVGAAVFLFLMFLDVVTNWGKLREAFKGFLSENPVARRVVIFYLLGLVMLGIGAFARFVERQEISGM